MAEDDRKHVLEKIAPGMRIETPEGDLGEHDLTAAVITNVVKDQQGNVEALEISKGAIFRKMLKVPADRVQSVAIEENGGSVLLDVDGQELETLAAFAEQQELRPESEKSQEDLLDQIEQAIPTEQGLREKEEGIYAVRPRGSFWRVIGPGLLTGTSGNDSSAVTTYAIDGATNGYSNLWLMLLATPLYQAAQFACAKIARVSERGLSQLLRQHYGAPISFIVSLLLIITNVALIAADLTAVGSGLELVTGVNWIWFVLPVALILWYLTVYGTFESFKKIFLTMSFVFVTYILTAFFSHANWGQVLVYTFVPHLDWSFASISGVVALLGATISPYSLFWQAQGELEERREGSRTQQLEAAKMDVASGAISGQVVAYFIIITTASTLFVHHQNINTAADAARALEPLAGPLARYLFAIGLVGSGLVAIPVLLASTSYAVAGSFGWSAGLSRRPWQNEGFYLILTAALIVGLSIALLRIDPISLIFWANILAGIIAPWLVITILVIGNNSRIMQKRRLHWLNNVALILTAAIMLVGAFMLIYSLVTGH